MDAPATAAAFDELVQRIERAAEAGVVDRICDFYGDPWSASAIGGWDIRHYTYVHHSLVIRARNHVMRNDLDAALTDLLAAERWIEASAHFWNHSRRFRAALSAAAGVGAVAACRCRAAVRRSGATRDRWADSGGWTQPDEPPGRGLSDESRRGRAARQAFHPRRARRRLVGGFNAAEPLVAQRRRTVAGLEPDVALVSQSRGCARAAC